MLKPWAIDKLGQLFVEIPAFIQQCSHPIRHQGVPALGCTNSVRPNNYLWLPNHIHLPHIPPCAWLSFNELAQIEALRNLLYPLFLLHPKIMLRVGMRQVNSAFTGLCGSGRRGGLNPPWVILILFSVVGWDLFEKTRGNKHLFGILHAISESSN